MFDGIFAMSRSTELSTEPVDVPRIFVIDDDAGARESVKVLLEPLGYPVLTFESGEAFLESLNDIEVAFGCALIDLRLKGMSGLSVLRALRESQPCVVPLLLTAFADVKVVVDALSSGAATVITKPYRDQDLWDSVSSGLVRSEKLVAEHRRKETLRAQFNRLTGSELQILRCLLRGDSNKQVAAVCDISVRTVGIRRAAILKKMVAASILELSWRIANSGLKFGLNSEEGAF